MALRVTFENTQEIILSNTYQGLLLPGHGVYYLFVTGKLGEVTEGAGKTPQEAINDRYAGKLSSNDKNIEIAAYVVLNAKELFDTLENFSPMAIKGYGYWGEPGQSAVTPYDRVCFAVLAIRKKIDSDSRATEIELNLPVELMPRLGI